MKKLSDICKALRSAWNAGYAAYHRVRDMQRRRTQITSEF